MHLQAILAALSARGPHYMPITISSKRIPIAHISLSYHIASNTKGPIIELGYGYCNTDMLHELSLALN